TRADAVRGVVGRSPLGSPNPAASFPAPLSDSTARHGSLHRDRLCRDNSYRWRSIAFPIIRFLGWSLVSCQDGSVPILLSPPLASSPRTRFPFLRVGARSRSGGRSGMAGPSDERSVAKRSELAEPCGIGLGLILDRHGPLRLVGS